MASSPFALPRRRLHRADDPDDVARAELDGQPLVPALTAAAADPAPAFESPRSFWASFLSFWASFVVVGEGRARRVT